MSAYVEDAAGLIAGLDRGESLPSRFYTDPAVAALELEHIFRTSWTYVGPLAELATTGDYITGYAGALPIVVVRNEAGLAAFVNVCRHRRHEVMNGRGNAKVMQCGYHAWTYDLDGCLTGAPRAASEPNFAVGDYPLLPLRTEALGPWVFVSADPTARPLHALFAKVLGLIGQSGVNVETLALYRRTTWTSRSNWKTMLENFLECYHCAVAHPRFSAAIDVRPENYQLSWGGWFCSQIGHVRQTALDGTGRIDVYDVTGAVAQAQYHLLWPNVTISINPGFPNLAVDVWVPDGPDRTRGFSEQYFAPGVSAAFAEELIAFNDEVGAEDDALTDSVQRGLLGGSPPQGRLLIASERLALGFQKLVAGSLAYGGSSPKLDVLAARG